MSIFPDVRNDDVYNEDFLGKWDRHFVDGYDYAIEQIKCLFGGNIDIYEDELNSELVDAFEQESEKIAQVIDDWSEMERNELITSMIDNMDEKKYLKRKNKALAATEKRKEYYDTIHFRITGKKRHREESENGEE